MMEVYAYIEKNIDRSTKRFGDVENTDETLLALPYPFTSPCMDGMFQEMYYWDTYFTNKGLFLLGRKQQALNNVRNMAFLLERYGKILNGNRTSYLNRSQPPFFGCMLEDALAYAPELLTVQEAFAWLQKEYNFWQTKRCTANGLNRYYTELTAAECSQKRVVDGFTERTGIPLESTEANGRNVIAESESGWDFTPRFSGRCTEHNPVDLNCLLYHDEVLLSRWAETLQDAAAAEKYQALAAERKEKIRRLMKSDGIYYDYDFQHSRRSAVVSCAGFFPFCFGIDDSTEDFQKLLRHLEAEHGVLACDEHSGRYQWSAPNSWAPLNYMAVAAAVRLGLITDAGRLAEKYCRSVEHLFAQTGDLWEKYDGVTGKLDRKSEYGTPAMLGWTAGVYVFFYHQLVQPHGFLAEC